MTNDPIHDGECRQERGGQQPQEDVVPPTRPTLTQGSFSELAGGLYDCFFAGIVVLGYAGMAAVFGGFVALMLCLLAPIWPYAAGAAAALTVAGWLARKLLGDKFFF